MLTRLNLHFFKCFDQLQFPLAPLTLLTDLNASGKSSVLQALVLLHQTMRDHEWTTRLVLNGSEVRLGGTMLAVVNEVFGRHSFEIGLTDSENTCDWTFAGTKAEHLSHSSDPNDRNAWPHGSATSMRGCVRRASVPVAPDYRMPRPGLRVAVADQYSEASA